MKKQEEVSELLDKVEASYLTKQDDLLFWRERAFKLLKTHREAQKNASNPIHSLSLFSIDEIACSYITGHHQNNLICFIWEMPGIKKENIEHLNALNKQFSKLEQLSFSLYCSVEDMILSSPDNEESFLYYDIARFNGINIDELKRIYFFQYHFDFEDECKKNVAFLSMQLNEYLRKNMSKKNQWIKNVIERRREIREHCFNNNIGFQHFFHHL